MSRAARAAGVVLAALMIASCTTGLLRPAGVAAPDAQWEEVSHAGKVYAEGVVAAKDGAVYVTDLTRTGLLREGNPRGTIYRYDPATGTTSKYLEPSGMANGLHVDKNGDLVVAQDADGGGRAVMRRNLITGQTS